jgi:hypothetical protein
MSPEEIRAKHLVLRNKVAGITPTLDREIALYLCEMLTELAAQQAETNARLSKVEA